MLKDIFILIATITNVLSIDFEFTLPKKSIECFGEVLEKSTFVALEIDSKFNDKDTTLTIFD